MFHYRVFTMPRSLAILLSCGLLLLGSLAFASSAGAATVAATTTCNNALGNGGATCTTSIVNTITATGGSAQVTVVECTGSAGVPDATCSTTTNTLTEPVTAVTQCNASINGGGGVLRCSVTVVNNFVGIDSAPTAATVNQCNGSGASGAIGATIICTPFPATTTNATITQCNDSGNGGTLVGLLCDASGTQSAGLSVLINQCNGSTNGGGTLTVCSASITNNNVAAATPTPTTAPTAGATTTPTTGGGSTPAPTPPTTDTFVSTDLPASDPTEAILVGIFVLAFLSLATVIGSRRYLRSIRLR
jgi:hypothetical protein